MRGVLLKRVGAFAILAAGAASVPLVGRLTEERNVRALAEHVGCDREQARRLYRLARRDGYGAAYAQVFPGRSIPSTEAFDTDPVDPRPRTN